MLDAHRVFKISWKSISKSRSYQYNIEQYAGTIMLLVPI